MELDGNDLLLEDFPEVVYPIQCLDGIANRCNGQLYKGERTPIGWTAPEIILPTIPGSNGSGAIIKVAGITGRIRGMKYKRADGKTVRPTLVVLDDPQTDESARSLSQCATRESILAGAVLGLSGPGNKISGIMPCTVICPGDMANNILDRDRHPEWADEPAQGAARRARPGEDHRSRSGIPAGRPLAAARHRPHSPLQGRRAAGEGAAAPLRVRGRGLRLAQRRRQGDHRLALQRLLVLQARRQRGKWAGGHPILGYDVDPRGFRLVVNEDEAVRVWAIFDLYLEHRSLLPVVRELERRGWVNKRWTTRNGRERGGQAFQE